MSTPATHSNVIVVFKSGTDTATIDAAAKDVEAQGAWYFWI
jgi:hypothetical protein